MNGRWGITVLFSLLLMNIIFDLPPSERAEANSQSGMTTLVSISSDGKQGDEPAFDQAISADGRFVVFSSKATNLVSEAAWPGVTNLYLRDRQTGTTSLLTVGVNGTPSYGHSVEPDISDDGRFVTFASSSPNLVPEDTNQTFDIFILDRLNNTTTRVSVSSAGAQANDASFAPSISADGRFIAYSSDASNLVDGDTATCHDYVFGGTKNCRDIFVYDLHNRTTIRVSIGQNGAQSNGESDQPSFSASGRFVAFASGASNLVDNDTATCVTFGDEVSCTDIFVYDRQTGATSLVSVASSGAQADRGGHRPSISADGNLVAFTSNAKNLTPSNKEWLNVYVHDRTTGSTTCISLTPGGAVTSSNIHSVTISDNGQFVSFSSSAADLVVGDTNNETDIFLYDRQIATLSRVSVATNGSEGNDHSLDVAISADGRTIAFSSRATNLVANDTNGLSDIFVHEPDTIPVPAPVITAMTPTSGIVGTPVTINGANLDGATSVKFNGAFASFSVVSSTQINATVPAGAISGKITVTTPAGTASSPSNFVVTANLSDFTIDSVEPIQVLEGQDLVRGKDTAVKVVVRQSGTAGAENLSVHLDVGSFFLNQFYVYEPGNLDEQFSLRDDNAIYPLNFAPGDTTKTIFFFSEYLRPTGSQFSVSAIVNPSGTIPESDLTNNTGAMIEPAKVYDTRWSGFLYTDLDIRIYSIGAVDENTYPQFAEQSADFARDMYPVANDRFSATINSSLWWTDLPGDVECIATGAAPEYQKKLNRWADKTSVALTIANPTADRFVVMAEDVPCVYGFHFPGTALTLVETSQEKTLPHELGHSYTLPHPTDAAQEVIDSPGFWVSKRRPMIPSDQRKIFNFMKGGVGPESWITSRNYEILFDDHKNDFSAVPFLETTDNKVIVATGHANLSGSFDLEAWYIIEDAATSDLTPGPYAFEYLDDVGDVIHVESFDLNFTINDTQYESISFVMKIPYIEDTSAIQIKYNDILRATKYRSLSSPIIEISQPLAGQTYASSLHIAWVATDNDSDDLIFSVLANRDNGAEWQTIAHGLQSTSYIWDLTHAVPGSNYLIKVIATDGFNSSEDVLDAPVFIESKVYSPIIVR